MVGMQLHPYNVVHLHPSSAGRQVMSDVRLQPELYYTLLGAAGLAETNMELHRQL